jgi:4-alpha-glucanotransferase
MKKDGFAWWIRRIRESFRLYDLLRLDHFRGFANYWAVPNGETTARNGRWRNGPGLPLFDAIRAACPEADLVAEDLGASDDGTVAAFLKATGLPGMQVLQFGFDIHDDNAHLPHNYTRNSVAYSSTHDNNTLLGWLFEAVTQEREYGLSYVGWQSGDRWRDGGPDSAVIRAFLRVLWQSCAQLVIIPVQDMLGYGADTRTNTPGLPTGQWRWRATADDLSRIDQPAFLALNQIFRRENPVLQATDT